MVRHDPRTDAGLDPAAKAEYMAEIVGGARPEDVWLTFTSAMERCGFTRLAYACLPAPNPGTPLNMSEALMLYRCPQELLDAYIDHELYLESPMARWAQENAGFAADTEIMSQVRLVPSVRLMRLLHLRLKFRSGTGYVGGFRDVVPGVIGGIALHAEPGRRAEEVHDIWALWGHDVRALARAMHLRMATLPHQVLRPLTTRQKEVLDWMSRGKTAAEVGIIAGLAVPTVEKHLRGAREALRAANTAEAVRKAIRLNLLDA